MQWMKNCYSAVAPPRFRLPKSTLVYLGMIWTLLSCRFLIFALVNLAKMEFLPRSVGKDQVWHIDIAYTSAYISLDDDLVVEFTDDEADEIF